MKKWNSFAVAGIACLMVLGYEIPSVVMTIEDDGRKSELKSYEIEEISLSFQNVNIDEEMAVFSDMLLNNILVEVGATSIEIRPDEGSQESQDYEGEVEYTKINDSINKFLKILSPESEIEFVDFKANYYVMMVSKEDERVYPIWECYGMDTQKQAYRFWLDDLTGTVLAFEVPYVIIGESDKALHMTIERIGNYYGYEIYGLAETISGAYKIDSWQNALMLFDEGGNEQNNLYIFKIGDRLLFNIFPGSVSFYDNSQSETE